MCIIAAKPAGVAMPSPEQIEVMWHNNPDGGGIMYVKDGSVYIDKGYMCLADYMQRLDELRAQTQAIIVSDTATINSRLSERIPVK